MSGAMGGSHGAGGGGVAVPPPFGLLPRGDQQTLLRLMSDNNYQNSKLGASFTPSQQLESCSFWRWASAWLQQPLPAVMLTGMYLRTEADQEWARLHQERRRQQQEWSQRHRRGQPAAAASIAAQVAAAPAADEVANVQQPAAPAEDDAAGVQQPAALAEDEAAGVQQPAAPAPDDAAGVQQPAAPAPDDAAEQAAPEAVPAAQAAAPPPTKSLVLGDPKSGAKLEGSDVLRLIFQMVPLKDRLGALSLVCRASRDLARELGVAGPWWLADVQEEKTSGLRKILRSVKAATLQHAPGLRLSAVIMRVPAKHRLGKRQWQRHGLDALALWPGQAQLRLLLKDEGTLDNWRLSSLTQLRTLRHLSLVRVERVPGVLSKLTQLKTLAWDGEFRGQLSSLNAALAPLRRLTPLYWHDRETKEGKPQ